MSPCVSVKRGSPWVQAAFWVCLKTGGGLGLLSVGLPENWFSRFFNRFERCKSSLHFGLRGEPLAAFGLPENSVAVRLDCPVRLAASILAERPTCGLPPPSIEEGLGCRIAGQFGQAGFAAYPMIGSSLHLFAAEALQRFRLPENRFPNFSISSNDAKAACTSVCSERTFGSIQAT